MWHDGRLTLVTAPAVEPVTLVEGLEHVKPDDDAENSRLLRSIRSAREYVEFISWRQLITATWAMRFDFGFPCGSAPISLPKPPLQSVISITYVDVNGVTQTLSPSLYQVEAPSGPQASRGRVMPIYGEPWPTVRPGFGSAVVTFRAGYGDSPANVPEGLRQAIQLLAAHQMQHPEPVVVGAGVTTFSEMPYSVDALITPFAIRD